MKLNKILALILLPVMASADGFTVAVVNKAATTTAVTAPSSAVTGYIEDIRVDVTGATTGTLSIARANGEVIFTNAAAITADGTYRVRMPVCNVSGTQIGATTGAWEKVYLNNEKLTIQLTEAAPVTNTYKIIVTTRR